MSYIVTIGVTRGDILLAQVLFNGRLLLRPNLAKRPLAGGQSPLEERLSG
jgi:hypothetical protein